MQTTMRKLFILLTMACAFMFTISCDELGLGDKNGNGVEAITFTDDEVKQICIANWDTNEDGELSHEEAAAITDLGDVFEGTEISSFDELQHFTSLKTIAEDAFYGCSDLKSITIPKNVSEIKLCAFLDCASLKSITIPKSVSGIENYAFYGCSSLTSVTIPDNVIKIGYGVFRNCSSMKSFSSKFASDDNRCLIVDGALNSFAPAGLTTYTIPNEVTVIDIGAFEGCSKLTSVTIPDSVTEIGFMAFSGCSALNSVTIPKGVTFIDEYAFEDCASLTSVYCMPTTPPEIGEEAFINHSPDLTIFVPKGCAAKYKAQWSEWKNMIAENNGNNDDGAENQKIYYTATEKVEPNETASFGANIISNDFDPNTGKGVIIFDDSVTEVGYFAFNLCSNLTSIIIPNSVTEIGMMAFFSCNNLTSVNIPDNVTKIGEEAFEFCSKLTSINIPDGVTEIGSGAFSYCSGLTKVTIPDSVTEIGAKVFMSCSNLTSFYGKFATKDNRCLIVNGELNSFAPANLTTYSIPNDVTKIGDYALYNCDILTDATIPDSVTSIGDYAFYSCNELTSVYCMPTTPPDIGENVFTNHSPDLTIFVPKGCVEDYQTQWSEWENMIAENNGNNDDVAENQKIYYTATEKVEPNETASFGANIISNDFDPNTGKGVIIFDNIVTEVGKEAFRSNLSLTSIALGDGVTEIGNGAFAGCRNLTTITIPSSVTTIKGSAFSICEKLTSITIPDNVTEIGSSAFSQCYELQSVSIGNGITKISNSLFSSCNKLTDVSLTDNITEIGENAFNGCSSLTTITIPNSVTAISANTFKNCRSLTAINIHNKITSIGYGAFNGCNGLQSVTIGNSVTKIEGYAFSVNNVSLASLTIPKSVTEIGSNAFSGMTVDELTINGAVVEAPFTGLFWHTNFTFKKLTIGGNITKIGERAFAGCKVETLEILNGVTAIESNAFLNCRNLTSVTMPSSITIVYAEAFKDCGNVKRVDISDLAAWCKTEFRGTLANPLYYGEAKLYLNNTEITELTIPSNVTAIKAYAFAGCSNSLKSVIIPKNVTEIGREAFRNCNADELIINSKAVETDYLTSANAGWHDYFNFKKCTIGDNVTTLGNRAFYGCSSLTSVTIPNSVTAIWYNAFYDCNSLTSITIPDSVWWIGYSAFEACSSLTSITIPDSVTEIGWYAFRDCSSLTSVYCKATTPPTGGLNMFNGNASGRKIYVPTASVDAYKAADYWKAYADDIVGYDF